MIAFDSPFKTLSHFKNIDDNQIVAYLKSPFWVINFDLLKHRLDRNVFHPLQYLKPKLSDDSFQKHSEILKNLCDPNFYFLSTIQQREKHDSSVTAK